MYYFRSEAKPEIRAVTHDREGSRLPPDLAPWTLTSQGVQAVAAGGNRPKPIQSGHMFDTIQKDGFYILRTGADD
jgi:hypothetical protein